MLENQFKSELQLAGRVSARGSRQVRRSLVVRRKVSDSNGLIELNKVSGSTGEAVVGDDDTPVIAVQRVEGFGYQFEFASGSQIKDAG